jgi:hypothetical protein
MDRWKDRAMGAAPVLIMLAVLGVEYGWQPDGTTSSRGDNIEYIVQISPDQAKQLGSIGEITSTIDPSIQGRVSRIVVRIGNDPLPKIAGRVTPSPSTLQARNSAVVDGDDAILPIPEIVDSMAGSSPANGNDRLSASVMKPDPQGSGFQMPESLQSGAASALEQVRSRAAQAATQTASQLEAQTRSALETQANNFATGASDAVNRAAASAQNGFNSLTNQNAPLSNPGVSTDPITNRDNRWSDISGRSSTPSAVAGPSTDPVDPSARAAGWPGFVGPTLPADPRSLTNPYAQAGAPASSFGASQGPASIPTNNSLDPALSTNANNTLARDPSDPKWSGYGTSPNFGALPGSTSPRTQYQASANQPAPTNAASATTPGLTNASPLNDPRYTNAATSTGYTQDAQGNYFDSLGRQVDRNGQPINPNAAKYVNSSGQPTDQYGNLLDASGQPVDQYGRRVDAYNRPISDTRVAQGTDPRATGLNNSSPTLYPPNYANNAASNPPSNVGATAADRFGTANQYDASTYSPNNSSYPQTTLTPPPLNQNGLSAQQITSMQNELRNYQMREAANTKLANYDEEAGSPSDQRYASAVRTASTDPVRSPVTVPTVKPRSVAAQPFFNFVLLISLVGNAYLIFETNNLRRKFRNMINSVRTSKVSAQPAT